MGGLHVQFQLSKVRKPPARGAATGRFAAITADTAARDPKKRPSRTLVVIFLL